MIFGGLKVFLPFSKLGQLNRGFLDLTPPVARALFYLKGYHPLVQKHTGPEFFALRSQKGL